MHYFLILFSYMKFMLLYDWSCKIIHKAQNNSKKVVLYVSRLSEWLNKMRTFKVFPSLKWQMLAFCLFLKPGLTFSSQSIQLNYILDFKIFLVLQNCKKQFFNNYTFFYKD